MLFSRSTPRIGAPYSTSSYMLRPTDHSQDKPGSIRESVLQMNALELAQADKFNLTFVVGEKERRIVLSKRGVVGMLHPILATADHSNREWGGPVENFAHLVESHGLYRV